MCRSIKPLGKRSKQKALQCFVVAGIEYDSSYIDEEKGSLFFGIR